MSCIKVPDILIPNNNIDLYKWAVVACDQFTSQPEYWKKTKEIVDSEYSTLNLIVPEVYLEDDVSERISIIHKNMKDYLNENVFQELSKGFILTERMINSCATRKGLVVAIDLEDYEYEEGVQSIIRPTEKTVVERIPPRLAVREDALLELPHIMILIDDPNFEVIEPMFEIRDSLPVLYDTELMQNGGRIKGWFLEEGKYTEEIIGKIDGFLNKDLFRNKYKLTEDKSVLNCIVGDGNHSLATAKAHWNNLKKSLSEDQINNHPARFCLCELVNIHDESLEIEPIHRVMFNVDERELLNSAIRYYNSRGCTCKILFDKETDNSIQNIPFYTENGEGIIVLKNSKWELAVAALQSFLDSYLELHPESKIDYIHGIDVALALGKKRGNMGFVLPPIEKKDLFRGVIINGVLPRKTFSMGEANEKRYYLEAKRIVEL